MPAHVDVEKLAATARADSPPAMPLGARNEEVRGEPRSWTRYVADNAGGLFDLKLEPRASADGQITPVERAILGG